MTDRTLRGRMRGAALEALYRGLAATAWTCNAPAGAAIWGRAWGGFGRRFPAHVTTRLHGHSVTVNAGYAYLMLSRRWATYNEPLVEVVHQAQVAAGRPATVIDVGAAIGDTVLLLRERLGAEVGEVWCIEGDAEFFPLLERNLAGLGSVHFVRAMLSDGGEWEPSLVRIHLGTASAQGFGRVGATTLDRVLAGVPGPIDVIKVDTDGLDGKVLAGAASVLDGARPAVIFEWHPGLYKATGNDWRRPFHVLAHCGYDRFAWFTKFGEFSHVDHAVDDRDVTSLAQLCLRGDGPTSDWHYDVVALHGDSPIDVNEVAALRTARATRRGWHRRHVSLAAGGSE